MIVKKNLDEIQNYLSDASNYSGVCEAVYFPETENEIIELLKKLNETKTKVTVSGNGTGLNGGRVPSEGLVISMERLNKILLLDKSDKAITVQPGVVLKDLQMYVESENLFYPPDPTETNCQIGATVATNASGAKTFKYGPTRDYVIKLRIALTNGNVLDISRGQFLSDGYNAKIKIAEEEYFFNIPVYQMPKTKNVSGYFCKENMDLIDLFIGSEGTLGIITELKLKLLELPKDVLSCVVFFKKEIEALNFIEESRLLSKKEKIEKEHLIDARGLEFFDNHSLNLLRNNYSNIPNESSAAVWLEQDIDNNYNEVIEEWMKLINKYDGLENKTWIAVDNKEHQRFKEFRHAIALQANEIVTSKGLRKVGTDVAVPHNEFVEFYFSCKKKVEAEGLDYVVYGHFGDSHMHLNILPRNIEEYNVSRNLYSEICQHAVLLNGTISAEHGIGKLKRDYLLNMYGENVIRQMAKLKLVFDPNKILGIGNIFDEKFLE